MAYQRGSLKKVMKKEGLMWVLRYRVGGSLSAGAILGHITPRKRGAAAEGN